MKLTEHRRVALLTAYLFILSLGPATASPSQGRFTIGSNEHGLVTPDAKVRLADIERRRNELHEHLSQARLRERLALLQLSRIQTKLNVTTGALNASKHKLNRTEHKLKETKQVLTQTRSDQLNLSEKAAQRLREIYEGQRMSLVDMIFQVQSLPALLDLCYYQERVADMDRQLLNELRARAVALESKQDKLGEQKNKLGDLVSEFAKRAMMIHQEKLNQEQIADKLKTQRAFYEQAERQLALESQRLETQILDLESQHKHSSEKMVQGSGNLSLPLQAQVTSPFGWRRHPIFGIRRFHTGIDLAGPNHSAVKAADSGNVLYTGWYGGYGKVVIVSHGKGMATLYAHLSAIKVSSGQNVSKGDILGCEGTTGFSTGPHLHFEVRVNGKPNNPLNYLK